MKRNLAALSCLLLLLLMMLGTITVQAGSAQAGGNLSVGISADIQIMDPHISWVVVDRYLIENVYEGLVELDESMQPVPALATSWEMTTPTEYKFKLRENVKFHNGEVFTSKDVKYSVERVINPSTGSRLKDEFKMVKGVEVLNDHTVKILLTEPYAPFISTLSTLKIIPYDSEDYISSNAVGTGPFRLNKYIPNQRTELDRFEDYWEEGVPYLDKIVFLPIPNPSTRIANLQTGQIQGVDIVEPAFIKRLEKDRSISLLKVPASATYDYFAFNFNRSILQNKKLRQAMAYAVNKEAIRIAVMEGASTPSQVPFPSDHWACNSKAVGYEYDLDKARELLSEAGYPNGGIDLEINVSPSYPEQIKMAEIWQEDLRKIGINLSLNSLEWATWLHKTVQERDYDIFISYSSPLILDPNAFLYYLYYTGGSLNINNYSNPELDSLLDEGRRVAETEKRKVIYDKIQEILVDDVPRVIIQHRQLTSAFFENVENVSLNARGDLKFKEVWLRKK